MVPGQTPLDLMLVAYAVLVMPALSVRNGRKLDSERSASLVPRYWRTMARGWLAAGALIGLWLWQDRDFAMLGLDQPVHLHGIYGLVFVAAWGVGLCIMLRNIRRFIKPARYPELMRQVRMMKILPRTAAELSVFLGVAVTAGIWEELMYRGYLIWFLAPYGGTLLAIALSSAVFGLGHLYQGWPGVVRTGVLGAIFAAAYVLTRSLWWVMAAHAMVDLWGGTLGWRVQRMPEAQSV